MDRDFLIVVDVILWVPILLALFVTLGQSGPSGRTRWTGLGFVGGLAYLASDPALPMRSLADQYASAANPTDQTTYLAAGQARLANYTGTAFDVYYVLASVAPMAISALMLRVPSFARVTVSTRHDWKPRGRGANGADRGNRALRGLGVRPRGLVPVPGPRPRTSGRCSHDGARRLPRIRAAPSRGGALRGSPSTQAKGLKTRGTSPHRVYSPTVVASVR